MSAIYGSTGNDEVHEILFTFDDGPHLKNTPHLLDSLSEFGIKAIFFVVGQNLQKNDYIDIVRRAHNAGHTIGNHTYTHADLTKLSESEIRSEIGKTHELIKEFLGDVKLFRPPYGAHNSIVDNIMTDFGYTIKLWNIDPEDWNVKNQPVKWITHALEQIKARSHCILLTHDIHASTVDNFKDFLTRLKQIEGVKFITA